MNTPSTCLRATLISSFIIAAFPLFALAQASPYGSRTESGSQETTGAYHPPAVYVSSVTLDSKTVGKELKGSFHILNQAEEIVGDIKYRVDVLSPLAALKEGDTVVADDPSFYSQTLVSEVLAFIPNEERDIPFAVTIPTLPSGEYRVRIQLLTSQGKELGWRDEVFQVTGNTVAFASLTHGPIQVPEFQGQVIPPTFGVNIAPNGSFTITARAENTTSLPLTGTPTLDVYTFDLTGEKISTQTGSAVTVAPNASTSISVPVTASATPGVYYAVLTIQDAQGVGVSSGTDYRWIVTGESGRILSARIATFATKQGEKVTVQVDYVGPADAKTKIEGKMKISVTDVQGVAGVFDVPETLSLTDAVATGEAMVTLNRNLIGAPGLEVVLTDVSGKVLDTYTVAIPLSEEQLRSLVGDNSSRASNPVFPVTIQIVLGVIILILVVASVAYAVWKKRAHVSLPPSVPPLLILFAIAGAFLLFPSVTEAGIRVVFPKTGYDVATLQGFENDWKQVDTRIIELFVNDPIHNSIQQRNNVPLAFKVVYGASNSSVSYARNFFRYAPGAKISTYEGTWNTLGEQLYIANNECPGGGDDKCTTPRIYTTPQNAGFNFALQSATAPDATLQLISRWGVDYIPFSTLPSTSAGLAGLADGINTWVKFAIPPTPPMITPLVCAPNARMSIDFIEIDNTKENNPSPTLPISIFGNGEQADDAEFVDLTRNGAFVLDSSLPVNVDGLAVQRGFEEGNGSITIQLYSKGNKGKECVIADINLENATFTGFENVGGKWGTRVEKPSNGVWRFCKGGKDEVHPGVGTNKAEMLSTAGLGNDTFRLFYQTASAATPTCPPPTTPPTTPAVDLKVAVGSGTPTDGPITIPSGTGAVLSWTSANTQACWATNAWTGWKTVPTGTEVTGNLTLTKTYTIQCWSATGTASAQDSVTVNVTPPAGPTNRQPVPAPKVSANGGTPALTAQVTRNSPVSLSFFADDSYDPDGWGTAGTGVAQGGKCEWNLDLELDDPSTPAFEVNFEHVMNNPAAASNCNVLNLAPRTFPNVGLYIYDVLKITDAGGLFNVGAIRIDVVDSVATPPTPTPTPNPPVCTAQCCDGADNDGDGRIDFGADPHCTGPTDNTENQTNPGGFEETR